MAHAVSESDLGGQGPGVVVEASGVGELTVHLGELGEVVGGDGAGPIAFVGAVGRGDGLAEGDGFAGPGAARGDEVWA